MLVSHEGGIVPAGTNGIRPNETAGETTDSDASKTCEFAVAPTLSASGAVAGRADGAEPEEVAVVPGGDHGQDAGADDVRDRLHHRVRPRVGLRPAAGEVDDVHPVRDRGLERGHDLRRRAGAAAAERKRDVEDAVVTDVRARRDAADVVHGGMAPAVRLASRSRGARPGRPSPPRPR